MNNLLENNIYSGMQYVQNVIFLIAAIGSIFGTKDSKQKAVLKGAAVTAGAFIFGFWMNNLVEGFFGYLKGRIGISQTQVLYLLATGTNVILMIGPLILAGAAVLWIFKGNKRTEIFLSVLFMLILSAITTFFQEITYNIFSPGRSGDERALPEWYIIILIDTVWIVITYLVYLSGFQKRLKNLLKIAEAQIRNIVLLPCISYAAFQAVNATMYTYGFSISVLEPGHLIIAVVMKISVLIMYVLMYWAVFQAITVGAGEARIKAELDVAGKIQKSALPNKFPAFPNRKEIDIYAAMHPAKEVGGDFYDFFFIDNEHLALLIADVSGKGVPAALFMMSGQSIIRNQALLGMDPGEIFSNANNQLVDNNKEGMFITAFLGILNVSTGELEFCNAGHNPPYIVYPYGEAEQMEVESGFVLAGLSDIKFKTEKRVLQPGEKLVLYTDGVTEAVNRGLDMYMEKRLEAALSSVSSSSAREVVEHVTASVKEFSAGAEQTDDITLLVAERMALSAGDL